MKLRLFLALSLAAITATSTVPSVFAQDGGVKTEKKARSGKAKLTPEESEKLQEARKAVIADPAVVAADQDFKAASREYNEGLKAALADKPQLQELQQKIRRKGEDAPSKEERAEWAAALKELNASPALKPLVEKRKAATDALADALKAAIVKADPSVAEIVEKAGPELTRGFSVPKQKKEKKEKKKKAPKEDTED